MGDTKIGWTDMVWNPVTGCSKVSQGCKNCYAERIFKWPYPDREFTDVQCHPERLERPLHWKKPRRIFVVSMGDPHHAAVPKEFLDRMLATIALCPHHTFLWLTKRAERMRAYFSDPQTPFRVQLALDALAVDMRDEYERWCAVVGYEGHYEVSSAGRVRSKTGRAVRPRPRGKGYRAVSLSKNGDVIDRLVQHIVLEAFVGPASEGEEARHANDCRSDNRLANLSWGTRHQNMADAARHGTAGAWMKGRATVTPEQVAEIRRRRAAGEKLDDIAEAVGSNRKQVSAIALGKIFKPAGISWPLPNVWLGVSVEDQASADERIPLLLDTPSTSRFLSVEPLLAPVDLQISAFNGADSISSLEGISWVIIGCESGPYRRFQGSSYRAAARDIIHQCQMANVPVFHKQMSINGKVSADLSDWPSDLQIREFPRGD